MKKILFVSLIMFAGCTDAEWAAQNAYGSKAKVTLYSGGVAVKTWHSTGKVATVKDSDGWFFMDSVTKKLITVSGPVVIEQE